MHETIIDFFKPKDRVWDEYCPIVQSKDGRECHIFLTDNIEVPSTYNEVYFKLITAQPGDSITLHINNDGGYLNAANMLYYAMKQCKASIHGILSGTVASAATVLTMACDTIEVAPYTEFMIHNYSGGVHGKGKEAKDQMDFVNNEINAAFREYYNGFLTEDEIADVIDDHDIWLNSNQVLERWAKKTSKDA